MTALGLVKTTLKSEIFSVMPMPNMTMPSSVLTQLVGIAACTGSGNTRAIIATRSAIIAMYLPVQPLIFSSVFI